MNDTTLGCFKKNAHSEIFVKVYKARTKCETHKVKPHKVRAACTMIVHPRLDIVNEPVRPLLFTISSRLLYQGKVFL